MLVVTIGSLVAIAALGVNLILAVWTGAPPRPVPMTTWLGVMILAASVLWTRWDEDETTIVAAVATAQPVCYPVSSLQAEPSLDGAVLTGIVVGASACNIWAV